MWVSRWVGWVEEIEAVGMSYCRLRVGGWVGGWVVGVDFEGLDVGGGCLLHISSDVIRTALCG